MTKTRFLALVAALVLLMTIPLTASAQRVPPHVFVGTATVDGAAAADGATVTAWVDGAEAGTATVADGSYVLQVDQVDASFAGKTVSFQIDGTDANETAAWAQGGADELALTVTGDGPAAPPPDDTTTEEPVPTPLPGLPGRPGREGPQGDPGPKGDTGATGATGAIGGDGANGAAGPAGPAGATGSTGSAGPAGNDGADGDDGSSILGIIAIILAAVAIVGAGGAYMMGRRT